MICVYLGTFTNPEIKVISLTSESESESPGGRFKNAYKLFNLRALKFNLWIKYASFNVWEKYFVWNFKGTLWNSTRNILPIHWKIILLYSTEILRALRFNVRFWNAPLVTKLKDVEVISGRMLQIKFMNIYYEIALGWMPQNTFDNKSTQVQVIPWCHQATSHHVNLCWPRMLSQYGVSSRQWVLNTSGSHWSM